MTSLLLVLPFFVAAGQDDAYRTLELGNRVQVTFRSGNTLTGNLIAVPKNPDEKITKVDYTKVLELMLDISWEYPGLNGTMTIPKDQNLILRARYMGGCVAARSLVFTPICIDL